MIKRIFALLLSLVFTTVCISATAFATTPEPTRHSIEIELNPGESINAVPTPDAMPAMWNQESHTVEAGTVLYTLHFNIPDRYFAYEVTARYPSGATSNETINVSLMYGSTTAIAGINVPLDNQPHKVDWIDIDTSAMYLFKITNTSMNNMYVNIVYYSWA